MSIVPLLELQQLQCVRDERVLFTGIDYMINSGDIVQIEGPNGSGKTTLLRTLIQLFPHDEGQMLWQGHPVSHVRYDFLSDLLFIGHLPGVKKTLTSRENLNFLANLQGYYTAEQVDEALVQVGLYGYEEVIGYQLSAGQSRRIALARLYLTQARLWILDEPYTALDAQGIGKLEMLFIQHVEQGGAVIFTSHQPSNLSNVKRLSLLDYRPQASHYEMQEEGVDDY
ncbi:hypothetical protein AB835_02385 [Candidatus Endobugula sertula]|uniref:ABC transporter domain-containing protein n=1 Tax=Candidatus Endobugula sertula TaxID=62101 RepID=A0A1D2QT13_9GAMM|nr:hypothetical protein AB835_02385 [Candidatus Endobugula sertula]